MRVSVSVVGRRRVYVELKARDLTFLPFNSRVAEDLSFRAPVGLAYAPAQCTCGVSVLDDMCKGSVTVS